MSSDIERLKAENSLSDLAARFGVALQSNGDEYEAACPFHEEDTPSFTIFPGRDGVERFHCFGCGARGDVMDFVQQIKGVDLREAINILGGRSNRDNVTPKRIAKARDIYEGIEPLPPAGELKAGRRVKLWNPKRDAFGAINPSMAFPYRSAAGDLIGYVLRHDYVDKNGKAKKETPMVMWCRLPDGSTEWTRYPFPKPRSLYRIEHLTPQGQIIIAEGEKCADIGAAVTGRLFMTWPGGTYGINHVDWSPLAGRSVVIWPDADAPGRETAALIAAILTGMGCTVKVMDIPEDKPDGWDVADAANDGWTKDDVDAFMRSSARPWQPDPEPEPEPDPPAPQPDADPGYDFIPPHFDEGERWEPDFGDYGDMQLDHSDDLIEYDPGKRRAVPASGRKITKVHFRVWGGDVDELREWAYLSGDDVFCNVHTGEMMKPRPFDRTMKNVTPMVEVENSKGETKNIKVSPSECLIDYCDGLVCSSTMYRPDIADMFAWVDGILHLNSFLPSSVPDADPAWQNHPAWRVARDHIENIIPDGAKIIVQWLAHNVQFPGRKILWAPIIVGEQGDGKTTVAKIIQMALGRKNVSPVGPEALFSDFNGWAEGKCVRILEELHMPGSNKASVVEKLKTPITNDTVDVVRKGRDGADVANVTNYIGLTNHINALQIPEGDRRWGVWRTRFKDRDQVLREMNKEYWHKVHEAIGRHPEVLRGWLLSIDLSDFDPKAAPEMTAAKKEMVSAGRTGAEAAVLAAIDLGGQGIADDVLVTDMLSAAVKEIEGRAPSTSSLPIILKKFGWVKAMQTDDNGDEKPMRLKWRDKNRHVYFKPGAWSEGLDVDDMRRVLRERLDETDMPLMNNDPVPW